MLSHYDAVVWDTGNDNVTRTHSQAGPSGQARAHDTQLAVRDFMNEGGRLLYTGSSPAVQYALAEYPIPVPGAGRVRRRARRPGLERAVK